MWKVGSCCDSIRGCLGVVGFVGLDFEGFVYYSMLRLSPEVSGSTEGEIGFCSVHF